MAEAVSVRTDVLRDGVGGANLTPIFLSVTFTASADILALVALKRIRVISLELIASATVTIKFQSGASTDLTGVMTVIVGVPLVLPWCPLGWFQTAVGEKLNVVQASAGTVSGSLVYVTLGQ